MEVVCVCVGGGGGKGGFREIINHSTLLKK